MKAKYSSLLLAVILLSTAFQCQDDFPNDSGVEPRQSCPNSSRPAWINDVIKSIEDNGGQGEIIRYRYHGEYVFLVDGCYQCPDYISSVYNCEKELLCSFGGIAGINTCPHFEDDATHEKVLWRNF